MKKVNLIGLALLAVLAFCAFAAVSASANEYLVEGAALGAGVSLAAETTGTVLLITYEKENELAKVLNEIECTGGAFLGIIEAKLGEVQKLLNAAGEEVSLALNKAVLCSVTFDGGQNTSTDCETGTNNAEVYADNLPWDLALTLVSATEWSSKFPATAGYEVVCKSLLGITGEGLCEGAQSVKLTNEAGTSPASVLAQFVALADAELASCTVFGIAQGKIGEVSGTGNTWALEGATRLATALS